MLRLVTGSLSTKKIGVGYVDDTSIPSNVLYATLQRMLLGVCYKMASEAKNNYNTFSIQIWLVFTL